MQDLEFRVMVAFTARETMVALDWNKLAILDTTSYAFFIRITLVGLRFACDFPSIVNARPIRSDVEKEVDDYYVIYESGFGTKAAILVLLGPNPRPVIFP